MDSFTLQHFAFDGEILGSSELKFSQLSEKWLKLCSELLDYHGPVFGTYLGSTLNHFHVKCTAGFCCFSVHNQVLYVAALLSSGSSEQNSKLIGLLSSQFGHTFPITHTEPALLIVNLLNEEISENEQHAMFQLAYHFAAAYFCWKST